jgi:hypothetical protein
LFIWLRRTRRIWLQLVIHILFSARFFCSSKRTEQEKTQNLIANFTTASSPQANEPKKRRPEMITFVWPYARYTSLIGATGQSKVRAISGLPSRRHIGCFVTFYLTPSGPNKLVHLPKGGGNIRFLPRVFNVFREFWQKSATLKLNIVKNKSPQGEQCHQIFFGKRLPFWRLRSEGRFK